MLKPVLVTAVVIDRPTCLRCIAQLAGFSEDEARRTLDALATITGPVSAERPCTVCGADGTAYWIDSPSPASAVPKCMRCSARLRDRDVVVYLDDGLVHRRCWQLGRAEEQLRQSSAVVRRNLDLLPGPDVANSSAEDDGPPPAQAIVDAIIGRGLCLDCIVGVADVERPRAEAVLEEIARHFAIRTDGACSECRRIATVYRFG